MAAIDWNTATTALDTGQMPCSSGKQRTFRLAASLAGGIPVSLSDTVTGPDDRNIEWLVTAIRHASGKRPETWPHLVQRRAPSIAGGLR
jgi:hypothetical protein